MKIGHINLSDIKGGAAIAASRLHQGLLSAGVDSSMFVAEKYGHDEHTFILKNDWLGYLIRRLHYRQLTSQFWRYALTRPNGLSPFTHPATPRNQDIVKNIPEVEIINLHWVANFIDLPSFLIRSRVPVVWTLHDMNAFTGGCHYTMGCQHFLDGCGECPQLGSSKKTDASRKIWIIKEGLYSSLPENKLHIVCPSQWLAVEASKNPLFNDKKISVIPNGIDLKKFKPYSKKLVREKFGLPEQAKIVLFSAVDIHSERKGLRFLLSALDKLNISTNFLLVSLGRGEINHELSIPTKSLGYINNDDQLAMAYSAADVFVLPSLQDNFPNTILESIACGTPVVAFDVGGIPDMVRPGLTGQLVKPGDSDQLGSAISILLANDSLRAEMGIHCRQFVEKKLDLNIQAKQYAQLYKKLLS